MEPNWNWSPKKIKDLKVKKPTDWDDRGRIPDADDKTADDWNESAHIVDPGATKPEEWNDKIDAEWNFPMIHNIEYKGEWGSKQINYPVHKWRLDVSRNS